MIEQLATIPIAATYVIISAIVLFVLRRIEHTSLATKLVQEIEETDKRRLYSGRFNTPDGAKRKASAIIRSHMLDLFRRTIGAVGLSLVAALFLFGFAVAAHWMWGLASGQAASASEILPIATKLFLGFVDAATFQVFVAFGIDLDMTEATIGMRVVNFCYLLSMVLVCASAVMSFARNCLTLAIAMAFPNALFRAADSDVLIEDNTLFERVVYYLLDFPKIQWS